MGTTTQAGQIDWDEVYAHDPYLNGSMDARTGEGPDYEKVKAAQDDAVERIKPTNPEYERWVRNMAVWEVMGGMMM